MELLAAEVAAGLACADGYSGFQHKVDRIAADLTDFFTNCSQQGLKVMAYGAAAKGNTLLNYAHIGRRQLGCVYDAAVAKQGKFLPGSHIPIVPPTQLSLDEPDFLLILPWNLASEVMQQVKHQVPAHCRFLIAVPELTFL